VTGIEVDRCGVCEGLWFDLREQEHLAEVPDAAKQIDLGDPKKGRRYDAMRKITCPKCGVTMLAMAVPGQGHIHYEQCPVCAGAFFDAGEFADYQELTVVERVKRFFSTFKKRT
jgi:Zn-finger nucleic acid-binding protein